MEDIRKKAKDLFPSFYLTLVSIIQSLALGYLLSSVKDSNQFWPLNNETLIAWLQVAAMCQVIFLIWHEYVVGVITFRWVLGISDSIIPFAFAILEFVLIALIGPSKLHLWLYFMAGFAFIALWAYINQYQKSKKDPDNEKVFQVIDSYPRGTMIFVAVTGVLFLVEGLLINFIKLSSCTQAALIVLVNIKFIVFIVRGRQLWQRLIDP